MIAEYGASHDSFLGVFPWFESDDHKFAIRSYLVLFDISQSLTRMSEWQQDLRDWPYLEMI